MRRNSTPYERGPAAAAPGARPASLAVALALALALVGCAGPKRLPPAGALPGRPGPAGPVVPTLLGVGLAERQPTAELVSGGAALVLDGQSGRQLARLEAPGHSVVCSRQGTDVLWRAAGLQGVSPGVRLAPVDPGNLLGWDGRSYRGDLLVIPAPGGPGLTVVNNLDLESYLQGVVPWEIGRHGADKRAALEAQAVAARTYTLSHLGERRDLGFDLFASVMDQVYKGATEEDPLCNEAIVRTRGLMLERDGVGIEAYYSACCGGISSQIEEVWPKEAAPYLISRPDTPLGGGDPFCSGYRYYSWEETWSAGRLQEILQDTLPKYLQYIRQGSRARWAGPVFTPRQGGVDADHPGRLLNLEILGRTRSGRIAHLAVTTEAGTYHVRGDRTRWVLAPAGGSPAVLRSALFDLELEGKPGSLQKITARGRGYGHGLGMCQAGALVMAERGYDFQEILAHYYPGARLASVSKEHRP